MFLPGNSRETIIDALEGLTDHPQIIASRVTNALSDAGFRVVHLDELSEILRGLLVAIEHHDRQGVDSMNPAVIKAQALLLMLSD